MSTSRMIVLAGFVLFALDDSWAHTQAARVTPIQQGTQVRALTGGSSELASPDGTTIPEKAHYITQIIKGRQGPSEDVLRSEDSLRERRDLLRQIKDLLRQRENLLRQGLTPVPGRQDLLSRGDDPSADVLSREDLLRERDDLLRQIRDLSRERENLLREGVTPAPPVPPGSVQSEKFKPGAPPPGNPPPPPQPPKPKPPPAPASFK